MSVDITTSAAGENSRAMARTAALSRIGMIYGMQPKYLRYNIWSADTEDRDGSGSAPICLADWTEHARPLPMVPLSEFSNAEAVKTIKDNPFLFKIVMPIDVD